MRGKNSRRGTTMVEVIVAFTVLLLIMGIFSQAMSLAERMMIRADQTMENSRELAGEYYLDGAGGSQTSVTVEFRIKPDSKIKVGVDSFTVDGVTARKYEKGGETITDVIKKASGG